jgi:hypothetical protein
VHYGCVGWRGVRGKGLGDAPAWQCSSRAKDDDSRQVTHKHEERLSRGQLHALGARVFGPEGEASGGHLQPRSPRDASAERTSRVGELRRSPATQPGGRRGSSAEAKAWLEVVLAVAAQVLPDSDKPDMVGESGDYDMPSDQGERLVGVTGFEPVASAV